MLKFESEEQIDPPTQIKHQKRHLEPENHFNRSMI